LDGDGKADTWEDSDGEVHRLYEKKRNAFITSMVNGTMMFSGELETGTRSWTNQSGTNPERDAYASGKPTDGYKGKKHRQDLQLMGHWGSTVKFRNPVIYPKE